MLYQSTNSFETPKKKNDNKFSYSNCKSKPKDRKDKQKREVFKDFGEIKRTIDFSSFDNRYNNLSSNSSFKSFKGQCENQLSIYGVVKLR